MFCKNIILDKDNRIRASKSNIIFITGISGSGKSTLANKIKLANSPKKVVIFPIDILFSFALYTRQEVLDRYLDKIEDFVLRDTFLSLVNEIPDSYFNYRDDFNDHLVSINSCNLFKLFLSKLLPELNKVKDSKYSPYYIFEGFQIFMENPKLFKDYSVIVLTTNYVKSAIRAYNRDKDKVYILNNHCVKIKGILFKKRILKMFSPNNVHFQGVKIVKKFIKDLRKEI